MALNRQDISTRPWRKLNLTSALSPGNNITGIAVPSASTAAAVAAGGNLSVGVWTIDYYYYDAASGGQSAYRYALGATLQATTTSVNKTISLTTLPSAVARSGDVVTHIRIVAKPPGESQFFYGNSAEYLVTLGTTTASLTANPIRSPDFAAAAVTDANRPCRIMAVSLTPTATDAKQLILGNALSGVAGADLIHMQAQLNGATAFVRFPGGGVRFDTAISYTLTGTAGFGEIYIMDELV